MPARKSDPALNLRPFDPAHRVILRRAAAARGITASQFVERLVRMHQAMANEAAAGNAKSAEILDAFDLGAVTR
jgi:uncharacterized protein (DUF1778 family)